MRASICCTGETLRNSKIGKIYEGTSKMQLQALAKMLTNNERTMLLDP